MFSKEINKPIEESSERRLRATDNSISVSSSLIEPSAIYKNCTNSFFDFLAAPSAIFVGTDTAARRNCETNPNFSSEGNNAVTLYISLTKPKLNFQASRFLCGFIKMISSKSNHLKQKFLRPLTVHCFPLTCCNIVPNVQGE